MAKRGPKTKNYTKKRRKELVELLTKYIKETDMPTLAHFGANNGVPKSSLYDIEELDELREMATTKKEAFLEREGISKNSTRSITFIIFALKQLGWTDNTKNLNVNLESDLEALEEEELDEEIKKAE